MPKRRLEDRIQDLVKQAVATQDYDELNEVIQQLRAALHEHASRLRKLAATNLIKIPRAKRASATDDMAAD